MIMVIVWVLSWWYSSGWKRQLIRAGEHTHALYDYFSIDMLVRTLFSPFRQIAANPSRKGSLDYAFRVFIDKLVSRVVGFTVRLLVLIIGAVALLLQQIILGVLLLAWPLVPALPILGVVAYINEWMPWN